MATVFKRGGKSNRGGSYYIQWYDHNGKRQSKSARTTDKAVAERIAGKLEADVALRRDGVIDAALDSISKQAQRSIESHLTDYEAKLRAADRDAKYIADTLGYIRAICSFANLRLAGDVDADKVNAFASDLKDKGKSARTVEAYLTAAKGFTKWLTEHQKLPRDPLASVKKPNPKTDRRRERRMLLHDEWARLEQATKSGPERNGMPGEERLLLYATTIQSGLRAGELRSLTRGRLYLQSEPPYITCKGSSTKNGKDARQYIQADLAERLRAHIATKAPRAAVFAMPSDTKLARMIRADLAEAREGWLKEVRNDPDEYARREESDFLVATNHEGEVFDFHSLRHTCGAWLAMAGVHVNVVQSVMRHSSITLTMDTYGHLFPGQEADAVARLPEILAAPVSALLATGTDDQSAVTANSAQQYAQQSGREMVRQSAITKRKRRATPVLETLALTC